MSNAAQSSSHAKPVSLFQDHTPCTAFMHPLRQFSQGADRTRRTRNRLQLHAVNVRKGEQKSDAFLALNANGKLPVLTTDERDFTLTESAAILVYLAKKHGKLLSQDPVRRARTFEQLFVHVSGLSPAFGQAGYFLKFAPEVMPHAIERFSGEANREL
ncbi:glutathione S-transferase family protein [Paraburkholderia strydomiana]|uniref:glutathione S-transferase family protein n=1 Tax=Paraburkholderia strydomiana TaxID=1245417 RepID=UPI00203577D5|nr:glutathione S-transferase N-terminal domain-containing protein [Paraburkholderia strydomiana]